MAYTVELFEWSSMEQFTDKTDGFVRLKNANNSVVDTDDAIIKPTTAGGTDFSYEKWLRLRITGDTTSGSGTASIRGLKFYTDGSNDMGTGAELFVRQTTEFAAPSEPSSTTEWTDAFTYESTNKLTLASTTEGFSALGHIGPWAVFSFRGSTGIASGLTGTETGTFEYSETT